MVLVMVGWRELLILLVIVVIVFGAKRLRNIGGDLGSAVKSFKKGMAGEDEQPPAQIGRDGEKPGEDTQRREPSASERRDD